MWIMNHYILIVIDFKKDVKNINYFTNFTKKLNESPEF